MMALAPASASISAEISPVLAPDALGWQSCAPTLRVFEPRARSAKAAIRVAGGQTKRSALAATSGAPASMASNSPNEAFRPFIFQLPAISGRMASVISGFPANRVHHALAECRGQFQMRSCNRRIVNRFNSPSPPRVRRGGCHFMMRYQLGDARLRNSVPDSPWARPGSLLQQVGPMLRGMRKASSNWLGKRIMPGVMGVLIISFGVWGIADIFRGFGQSTLATVGRTEISINEFRQLYTEKLQQIGRQFGRPLTMDQARAFGLDRQVLQQTIAEAALDEEARRLGLGQSEAETMRLIFSDPNFKGTNGAFDPARFEATIRQAGFTEQRYIADQRRVSLRRQIAGTISAGLEPPNVLIEALSRFQNEQRAIEYVKLDAAHAGPIDPPSPKTLAGYFDDHKTQFRAPEYRKISFVAITPEELGKWSEVSDEDAKKLFEQRRDRLGTPEQRQLSQIVFPNAEEALSARNRIAAGMSFEDLAKERGLNPSDVDLGMVAKSAVIDPAIADAAFALPSGEVSQPVQGKFGVALVKVGKIEPGVEPSYEAVASNLKKEIATERARTKAAELRDKMEDER